MIELESEKVNEGELNIVEMEKLLEESKQALTEFEITKSSIKATLTAIVNNRDVLANKMKNEVEMKNEKSKNYIWIPKKMHKEFFEILDLHAENISNFPKNCEMSNKFDQLSGQPLQLDYENSQRFFTDITMSLDFTEKHRETITDPEENFDPVVSSPPDLNNTI